MVVFGEGGHTTELLRLVDMLGDKYQYIYLHAAEDTLSVDRIKLTGTTYAVVRPRKEPGLKHDLLRDSWLTFKCLTQVITILSRTRPTMVVLNGPWISGVVAVASKLLGIDSVYIETGSRVYNLSGTGKIVRRFVNEFYVQWPTLLEKYPDTKYAGRLL